MNLERFCAKQFLTFSQCKAFASWLGDRAKGKKSESKWLELFSEWVRSK